MREGTAYALFAYDVGLGVSLEEAERRLAALAARAPIRHQQRAPKYFDFQPHPLRVTQNAPSVELGAWRTLPGAEVVVYDFGAASVAYRIPFSGPLSSAAKLSEILYDNQALLADSRRLVEDLLAGIGPAAHKPRVSDFYEDYAIFQIRELEDPGARRRLLAENPVALAQILRADTELSSEQEVQDAVSCQASYGAEDLTLVDWASAVVFGKGAEDTRAVLEFACVQLLELRHLDSLLDSALDRYYASLSSEGARGWRSLFSRADSRLREVGRLQVESAVLFEGVNNAIKLIGDQYLARLYQQAARRHRLSVWDENIQRKLRTLESIYDTMEQSLSSARLEFIEWIVVLLIALEIAMPLLKRALAP